MSSPESSTSTAETLLATAVELLEREGPAALTVRRVSHAAGMSTIGIYSHFESKEGLIGAVWAEGFARLLGALDEVTGRGVDLVAGLGARYVEWAVAHPHLYGVMFWRSIPEVVVDDRARSIAAAAFERLVEACETLSPTPVTSALAVWQYVHGAASLEIALVMPPGATGHHPDTRAAIERLLGIGVGPDDSQLGSCLKTSRAT